MIFGQFCRKTADETTMPVVIKIVLSDLNDGGDDRTTGQKLRCQSLAIIAIMSLCQMILVVIKIVLNGRRIWCFSRWW